MILSRHFLASPSRLLSVFSFGARGRRRPADCVTSDLSDAILCDIGVSRCLLLAGCCQADPTD